MLKFLFGLASLFAGIVSLLFVHIEIEQPPERIAIYTITIIGFIIMLHYIFYSPVIIRPCNILPQPKEWMLKTYDRSEKITDILFIICAICYLIFSFYYF